MTVLLDGDNVRHGLNKNLGFTGARGRGKDCCTLVCRTSSHRLRSGPLLCRRARLL
jgi:adenylylsulfate kinase-like enzyme